MGKHYEIERKYLIRYPDEALLASQPGAVKWEIEQVYLTSEPGETRRVRRVQVNGETHCYKTFKRRVTGMTAQEDEGEIDEAAYEALLSEADPIRRAILKTRYRIPWQGFLLEFDLYPFWKKQAVLEIELESEWQTPAIPDWVSVIRDVSSDFAYKNSQLAFTIPAE